MSEGTERTTDVFGVGNALVDVLALVDEDFVREHDLPKGGMLLVDTEKQGGLLRALEGHTLEMRSGGSAANTMIAIAQSGGNGFYSGKVARDTNGEFYRQDLLESGVHFDVHPAAEENNPTGTCVVLTTPDAERTMLTHLGVSTQLGPTDIDSDRLAKCKYSYIEGYLWDPPSPRKASVTAMEESKKHHVKVSFTFSDPFLVDRFTDDFRNVVKEYCDVLFCNADECRRFCETESLDEAVQQIGKMVDLAFITDGARGCRIVENGNPSVVEGFEVNAIDTVGAGDAFAGGALFGLTHGYSAKQAARWGNYLAAEVVSIQGARLHGRMTDKLGAIIATN